MTPNKVDFENKFKAISSVLTDEKERRAFSVQFRSSDGNIAEALRTLRGKLPEMSLHQLGLASVLADWSGDNVSIIKALSATGTIRNLRDVALNYGISGLMTLIKDTDLPEEISDETPEERKRDLATVLRQRLFSAEPTAVLHRMVRDAEVPIADTNLRSGVVSFLNNQPDFNIRTTSVYNAFKNAGAFNGIADEHRAGVVEQLKALQRVQAISPVPEAVPILMNANLTSAFHVAEKPESTFLDAYSPMLGEGVARQVYTNAINTHIRNEHALMTIREALRGPGLGIMGGSEPMEARLPRMQELADKHAVPLNLETLFGNIDYCECDDCLSVYSPAAYFVELLQYLRNNNLDPTKPNTGKTGIAGTVLEKLFRRRPDLGCLELTCENTFTVLPYVDLANEVMESFVVHLGKYHTDTNDPKQATLEVFNVTDETTAELLAQPQHVNYQAYCILKNAVYPFTLPYHQPIDVIRIWLKNFGTSRCELLDTFRSATEKCDTAVLTPAQLEQLRQLHEAVSDRSVEAEFLGITQEEYIIITREAFWPKSYFDLTLQKTHTDDEYRQKIGVKPVQEYYGYPNEADMLNVDETAKLGLTFVKKQFLPRTGILYTDLVSLLKTRFINPAYPQGEALAIMETLRFSYRFLQTLIDTASTDPKVRFAKLISFLNTNQPLVPSIDALLHPHPCHAQITDCCTQHSDFANWVYCYFNRIGRLIVLDSGEGPQFGISGQLFTDHLIGTLRKDGTVIDKDGGIIATISLTGQLVWNDGSGFESKFGDEILIKDADESVIGYIHADGVTGTREERIGWLPARDTCDLDKVRLVHLDGTEVTTPEYDRIQRFIRLWHKIGWGIEETDRALIGLWNTTESAGMGGTADGRSASVGFDAFEDTCSSEPGTGSDESRCTKGLGDGNCPDIPPAPEEISSSFIHELVAIKKLLDLTGLTIEKLLTFWADIGTNGEKPLYARLFLSHNILGIDKVFQSDKNGNFLVAAAKISDHIPVLMAALKLKADDIATVMEYRKLADALTLANVSSLFCHALLAKLLHLPVSYLPDVLSLFGDPFQSAANALSLLTDWGNMEDAGFSFSQLNYVLQDKDDPKRPVAPRKKTVLVIAKALYDGLNTIDHDHPDIPSDGKDTATDELVRSKASLLFEQTVVDQIISLLDGTTAYSTYAPANQIIKVPDPLAQKLQYLNQKDSTPPAAIIQVTGILTEPENTLAKSLSSAPGWSAAIDRVAKQRKNLFSDVLFGIFPDVKEATENLLSGDVNVAPDPDNPSATDGNTAPAKRLYFLRYFVPFLRKQLAHKLIVNTLSGNSGLTAEITDVLLSTVLTAGSSKQPAIEVLKSIQLKSDGGSTGWKGYLIPPAQGTYTFAAISDSQPSPIVLNGSSIAFPHQQDDPSNVWSTDSITLESGTLYPLETNIPALQWKTDTSPKSQIPSSALLPDYSSAAVLEVFTKLAKAAVLINGFGLTSGEIAYFQKHPDDFDGMDFNGTTVQHWRRLRSYRSLREALPKSDFTLIDLFAWTHSDVDSSKLNERISAATGWNADDLGRLIAPEHFDLNRPNAFSNEIGLVQLQKALKLSGSVTVGVDRLFEWANPKSKFSICHQIAEQVQAALRARYDQEDWEKVVKPLYDQLRQNQQQALVSYLLVQQDLIDWGVIDADSLFEFFLIDVQMCSCMETSRIKQAISTAQLFIQRCLLGMEEKYGVPNRVLDRDRWEWMQKYRVWEANRKVFLYPENWLRPELRDDKSQFYKELESELLQKDVNPQTIADALRNYSFKLDEVANPKIAGIFVEYADDGSGGFRQTILHIVARTRSAPYAFYYRYFDQLQNNWYPWEKMQVDIPSYDVEATSDGHVAITGNGAYVVPVVWNKRLLVFFPQFTRKTAPNPSAIGQNFHQFANTNVDESKPIELWEIKMGWTEYRNKKWTPKQIATEGLYTVVGKVTDPLDPINKFQCIPRFFFEPDPKIVIEIYSSGAVIGGYAFHGTHVTKEPDTNEIPLPPMASSAMSQTDFHYQKDNTLHSYQVNSTNYPPLLSVPPYFEDMVNATVYHGPGSSFAVHDGLSHPRLGSLSSGQLDDLFNFYSQVSDPGVRNDAYGRDGADLTGLAPYNELRRPAAYGNWELGFHALMQLADAALLRNQFDLAFQMYHYILNPFASGDDEKRFWAFPPFKETDSDDVLERLFLSLKPNQPDTAVNEWRDKPFQPHVIARQRPSAYMKWVAMKYIAAWIANGDYYFRQNTLETIPLAMQSYVMASHVYGPTGQIIPRRGKTLPQTYNSLLDKWDAFGNAMVELELAFPFSNQTSLPMGSSNGVVGLANVFGFATSLYFCIPDNPQLRSLRETIDDRLFKIRHCEDIDGVFRQLPLFEPPIDPALLVEAAAQGLSLSAVLNDLNSPMPNYRFYYLLQKAFELCTELKALGNALLSVKEKEDSEKLSLLRAQHESGIQNLIMDVKKQQLDEANAALDALEQSRKGPVYRLQHFLKLIGEDLSKVPDEGTDFSEVADQIENPIDESGLKLISFEKEEMDKAAEANDKQEDIGRMETLASILHIIPDINIKAEPIGVGVSTAVLHGLGNAAQAIARANQVVVGNRTFSSANAGRKAGFLRQLQDRIQQANAAGYETKSIDKQILTQKIRVSLAEREISNQQKLIDNAQEVEEFLRSKYTNQELYSWMDGQLRSLCYQTYTLASDLYSKALALFRFDRSPTSSDFVKRSCWDPAHDGLLSGELLYSELKRLEAAYQEKRGYDFEISKTISLRQIDPMALLQLRETGSCEFTVPEILFDMDYPGHYMRRIKSVSLRIPCVLGPNTSLNCTLRLLEHKYRVSAIAKDKNDYPESTEGEDSRFITTNVPISSIAVSSLDHESGVFELNFRDERYLPFEGAGAISKWRIELPAEFRQYDYDTISEPSMKILYTSLDGGDKLKGAAMDALRAYIRSVEDLSQEQGLFMAFDLKSDFANEWYASNHPVSGATERVLTLANLAEKLPVFTKGYSKMNASDIYLFVSSSLSAASFSAKQGGNDIPFVDGPPIGKNMKSFVAKEVNTAVDTLEIKIADVTTAITKMWLVERYTLA